MTRFSFKLDRILNYRKYLEKKAQRDLFHARNEYRSRERAIKRYARKRMEIARVCSDEGLKGIDVPQYQIYRSFLQRLNHDLEEAHMNLKKEAQKVAAQEVVLRKASIKKKSLESLKDVQLDKHIRGLEREEQKVMDELVITRRRGKS